MKQKTSLFSLSIFILSRFRVFVEELYVLRGVGTETLPPNNFFIELLTLHLHTGVTLVPLTSTLQLHQSGQTHKV